MLCRSMMLRLWIPAIALAMVAPVFAPRPARAKGIDLAEGRKFWSLQPLRRVDPPAVKDVGWCRTAVDRFILARLEEKGIAPTRAADRRVLIRRVYFDLLGLPPTPDEIDAFVADADPNAYEKLVDRLLASPHYGERWGRRWLDLARFAESHGFEQDDDRPTAYPYRDFVIKALNEDLPYDTFVKWQLAGDELAPDDPQALTATGFLAAGTHSTQITKREVEKTRYDELDDIVATTGTAMLGMTIGCARCHDHKFDPIPTRDYYRLISIFTTTVRSEVDIDLGSESYRHAKEAFDREHAPLAAALEKFEREELPGRLEKWLQAQREKPAAADDAAHERKWIVLDPVQAKSQGGANFSKQDDGSLLASGTNPDFDTYTFVVHTGVKDIAAVRLDAMADPSMVKNGPGRASNGNFALSDFRVEAAPADHPEARARIALRNPRATFEQTKPSLPVSAAVDADKHSAWAVDPQFGKTQSASFDFDAPVGFDAGTILTFTLEFRNNNRHSIGRPRLSIATSGASLPLGAAVVPQALAELQALPAAQRDLAHLSKEQQATLSRWYRRQDSDWQRLNKQVQEHLSLAPPEHRTKALICSEGVPPLRLRSQGDDFFKESYFLKRGNPDMKDGVATPGYLQVLTDPADDERHWEIKPPPGAHTSFRRASFANWMTDVDHGAGRLLARVIVNRLWQGHFGRGIVATPSDFGTRGDPPSHPELLDYLATELIANGWRLKPIHKLILTSSVYLQGADVDEAKQHADPENQLVWHHPRTRMEAEIVRDEMLAVAGVLDDRMFGPGTLDESMRRRSIYFTVKRSHLIPMLQVFDAPDALGSLPERAVTTVAPQALLLMNDPHVREYARALAKRAAPQTTASDEQAITAGYRLALGRAPTDGEQADGIAFLKQQRASYSAEKKADASELALTDFCQALFCLNEFVYVD